MRRHRLLVGIGTLMASGALALTPVAVGSTPTGGPIAEVYVDGVAGTDNDITATMKSVSVAITLYGFIPINLTCTAGSASGYVDDGPTSNPTGGVIIFDTLNLTCPPIFPDTEVEMEATCDVGVRFSDTNVHSGLVDTGTGAKFNRVAGSATSFGAQFNDCVRVTKSDGCTYTIGGSATVAFDEALKTGGTQELILSGNTVRINDPVNCAGAVSDNQTFTLNAVFNIDVPGGTNTIDFRPAS